MKKYSWLSIPISFALSCITIAPAMSDLLNRPDFFEKGRQQLEREIRRLENRQERYSNSPLKVDETAVSWSRVVIEKAGLTLLMPPGAITHEVKTIEDPKGNINFNIIATHPQSSRYVIAYSEEVAPQRFSNTQEVLKQAQNSIIANNVGFSKVTDKDILFKNYPGKQFKLKNRKEIIIFRLILIKQRLYIMAVNQPSDEVSTKAINAFFDSFKLIN